MIRIVLVNGEVIKIYGSMADFCETISSNSAEWFKLEACEVTYHETRKYMIRRDAIICVEEV